MAHPSRAIHIPAAPDSRPRARLAKGINTTGFRRRSSSASGALLCQGRGISDNVQNRTIHCCQQSEQPNHASFFHPCRLGGLGMESIGAALGPTEFNYRRDGARQLENYGKIG